MIKEHIESISSEMYEESFVTKGRKYIEAISDELQLQSINRKRA